MKIKAIITGSSGMVGKGVLLECLESSLVESVLVVNRESIDIKHDKLKEIIHSDFFDLSAVKSEFTDYNTCFFCLGVSSAGLSEADYHRLTYDLTLNFAKTVSGLNEDMIFCYVSGAGTDNTEKGRSMWARVKGKTENALMKLPFKATFMFRPAYIQPMKGVKSKTRFYQIVYDVFGFLYPVSKVLFPKSVTTTEVLGLAMIKAVSEGYDDQILETRQINQLAIPNS